MAGTEAAETEPAGRLHQPHFQSAYDPELRAAPRVVSAARDVSDALALHLRAPVSRALRGRSYHAAEVE